MALKAFSSRMFPETVTVHVVSHSSDDRAGDTATPGTGTTYDARILPDQGHRRSNPDGRVLGQNVFELSTSENPSLRADDKVVWGTKTLVAISPSVNVGGESKRWSTMLMEID